jgi:ACS family D-galactonate transporter-like MFS transporter
MFRTFPLVVVSVWINYLDRGNLSVAAPQLAPDLGLTPTQVGALLSAFFWTYSVLQVAGGWLVDRFPVAKVYASGYLLWTLATLATGFANSFAALLALRMLLGAGESVAYPAYSRLLSAMFPESKRGFANALIDTGTKGGPALGIFAGGFLMAQFGWRAMFVAIGGLSLVWLPFWFRATRSGLPQTARPQAAGTFAEIARRSDAWLTFAGLFCFNYGFYFLLSWLPSYLVAERGYSLRMMAVFGALPYVATAAASLAAGAASDRWIRRGCPARRVRSRLAAGGLLACGFALGSSAFGSNVASMINLIVAFAALGVFTSQVWAITQALAGTRLAGRWTGLQNALGNLGGVAAPVVTGALVERSGSFAPAFLTAAAFVLAAAGLYGALARRPSGDAGPA